MKTCKEMAEVWNVTERTVTIFCKSGKIPGVVKNGKICLTSHRHRWANLW